MGAETLERNYRSLKFNMVLNGIKGFLGVIFPIITFPYVSKILGVENIGKYNFANSIISYYVLIAGLGIAPYAIREGARIRERKSEFYGFANEIYSINIVSTIISFLLLFPLLMMPKLQPYRSLMLIFSVQIVFKTIGIEWYFSVYEKYTYITVRSILFQIISLILLFLLVHRPEDINLYAAITVFSGVGSNLLNFFYVMRNDCKIRWTWKVPWRKHIKPIMTMFATSVAVTVYVSSDVIVLGFICGDYRVGIYSTATKVYTVVKTILSAVIAVSLPRLSSILGEEDKKKFQNVSSNIYMMLLTFMLPAVIGIIVLRREIILLISNDTYMGAAVPLSLLAIALIFCMCACYWSQCILIPLQMEKTVFWATVISAGLNIGLNFMLIPRYKENAAAFSTIVAEAYVFLRCYFESKKYLEKIKIGKILFKIGTGCGFIVLTALLIHRYIEGELEITILTIIISMTGYFVIELLLGNEIVRDVFRRIKKKVS